MLENQNTCEALLVHLADPAFRLHLAEMPLPQDGILRIGRQAGLVDLLISEGSVSRLHAEICSASGHYLLQDMGSTNGSFVNERRLTSSCPYILQPNDMLRFGNIVRLKFLLRPIIYRSVAIQAPSAMNGSGRSANFLLDGNDQEQQTRGLAVINADGTLSTPGSVVLVSAEIVAQLKKKPALVVVPSGSAKQGVLPQVYFLQLEQSVTIGREVDNDIVLDDVNVSRYHAEVFYRSHGFSIRDKGSTYGTLVNQSKVLDPRPLSHSDRIKLGSTRIFFIDLQAGSEVTSKRNSVTLSALAAPPEPRFQTASVAESEMCSARSDVQTIHRDALQLGNVVICPYCGIANTHIARFCASCSSLLVS